MSVRKFVVKLRPCFAPAEKPHTLTLISKALGLGELAPAFVPAFVSTQGWPTPTLLTRVFDHGRFALERNEGVVDDNVDGAEIAGAMHAAINLLETLAWGQCLHAAAAVFYCQRAALDRVKGVTGMIVPRQCFVRFERKNSHRDRSRSVEQL